MGAPRWGRRNRRWRCARAGGRGRRGGRQAARHDHAHGHVDGDAHHAARLVHPAVVREQILFLGADRGHVVQGPLLEARLRGPAADLVPAHGRRRGVGARHAAPEPGEHRVEQHHHRHGRHDQDPQGLGHRPHGHVGRLVVHHARRQARRHMVGTPLLRAGPRRPGGALGQRLVPLRRMRRGLVVAVLHACSWSRARTSGSPTESSGREARPRTKYQSHTPPIPTTAVTSIQCG